MGCMCRKQIYCYLFCAIYLVNIIINIIYLMILLSNRISKDRQSELFFKSESVTKFVDSVRETQILRTF